MAQGSLHVSSPLVSGSLLQGGGALAPHSARSARPHRCSITVHTISLPCPVCAGSPSSHPFWRRAHHGTRRSPGLPLSSHKLVGGEPLRRAGPPSSGAARSPQNLWLTALQCCCYGFLQPCCPTNCGLLPKLLHQAIQLHLLRTFLSYYYSPLGGVNL